MSSRVRLSTAVLSVLVLASGTSSSLAADVPTTVLVIPAKPSIVAFCADVAMMRPMDVVSYEVSRKTNAPALTLNLWNGNSREWTRTTLEDYRSGSIFREMPARVVLVGNNEGVLADLRGASVAMGEISKVSNLDTMGLANGLNGIFTFTTSEWKFLARKYELKLKDLNSERRRYGKYGPPGSTTSVPMPKVDDEKPFKGPAPLDLPPAEPVLPATKMPPRISRAKAGNTQYATLNVHAQVETQSIVC